MSGEMWSDGILHKRLDTGTPRAATFDATVSRGGIFMLAREDLSESPPGQRVWPSKRVGDATSIKEKSSVPQPCEIAEHAIVLETQAGIPPIK
jgi:hypothetical protein